MLDGELVTIGAKKDRHHLQVIMLKSRQVCQLRTDVFDSEKASCEFMLDLAQSLVQTKITVEGLYAERNQRLKALGLTTRCGRGQVSKRQAKSSD